MPNPVPKKRECKFCGAPYYFQNNKVMYCSEKCRVYAWREKRRGKHKAKRARRSELTKLHEKRKRK